MSRVFGCVLLPLALALASCDVEVADTPDGSQAQADANGSTDAGASPDVGEVDAGQLSPDASLPLPDAAGHLDAAAAGHDGAVPGTDASAPGADAAAPECDAALAGPDAAAPGRDAAMAGPDAAAPGPDAGSPGLDASATSPTPIWLLHITDTHIGENTVAAPNDLAAFVAQVLPVVKPMITLHTGDLTDSGSAAEFSDYRSFLVEKVPAYPNYVEVIGNHDVKDNGTTNFLASSLTGAAGAGPYGLTYVDLPEGRVQIARTNTSDSTSNMTNIAGIITAGQVSALLALPPSQLPVAYSLLMAHHPYSALTGDTNMQQVVDHFKPQIYFCGHVHKWDISWQGRTLVIQAATLGKVTGTETHFALAALDDDGPAAKNVTIDYTLTPATQWPLVLVTRPADAKLAGTNPVAAPLAASRAGVALRALAFAPSPITSVEFQVDLGAWTPMTNASQSVWAGTFTAPASPGSHTINVTAKSAEGSATDSVTVTVQ